MFSFNEKEEWHVDAIRVCRPCRETGPQLRNKSPKKRARAQLREVRSPAQKSNQIGVMDFVHDQLFDGRKFRVQHVHAILTGD